METKDWLVTVTYSDGDYPPVPVRVFGTDAEIVKVLRTFVAPLVSDGISIDWDIENNDPEKYHDYTAFLTNGEKVEVSAVSFNSLRIETASRYLEDAE